MLRTLAAWGAPDLGEPRPTDAVRAHWYAIPLLGAIAELGAGVVQVSLDEGEFHVRVGDDGTASYGDGVFGAGTTEVPDARLRTDTATCRALAGGELTLAEAIETGRAALERPVGAALA